ncbi:hypothetical protein PISMIDRAFT_686723, partial [Pisolithus microcarpus 441]
MEDLVAFTQVLFQTPIFMTVPLVPTPAPIIGHRQTLREATLTPVLLSQFIESYSVPPAAAPTLL